MMLEQLKKEKLSDTSKSPVTINTAGNNHLAHKNKLSSLKSNIKEEDENNDTEMSLYNSNKSSMTEKVVNSNFKRNYKDHRYYGNVSTNHTLKRNKDNRSANRYTNIKLKQNKLLKDKEKSRREKSMIKDRLHILDRLSTSLNNEDIKSSTDFSDARSINRKKKLK